MNEHTRQTLKEMSRQTTNPQVRAKIESMLYEGRRSPGGCGDKVIVSVQRHKGAKNET